MKKQKERHGTLLMEQETNQSKVYTANVIDILENGDAVLELPDDMLKELGWDVGDVLNIDSVDGQVIISKPSAEHVLQKITTKQGAHPMKNYPFSRNGVAYRCTKCGEIWLKSKDANNTKCTPKD